MALPTDPLGRELALTIWREQYTRWQASQFFDVLRESFDRIASQIVDQWSDALPGSRTRLALLYSTLDGYLREGYTKAARELLDDLGLYDGLEREIARGTARTMIVDAGGEVGTIGAGPVLTHETISAIAELPLDGLPLGDWWEQQAVSMTRRVRQAIQVGLTTGQGPREIARSIVPPRGQLDAMGPNVWRLARRNATIVVRTATTAVHNNASLATYKNIGAHVVGSLKVRAVLDARTSSICRAKDSEVVPIDRAQPGVTIPPFHLQCRSTTEAIINYRELGLKKPVEIGDRSWKSYAGWLKEQSNAEQNRILGTARAGLWRSGRLSLQDFIDNDNTELSLIQLAAKAGVPRTGRKAKAPAA